MPCITIKTVKTLKIVLYIFGFLYPKFSSSLPKYVEFWFNPLNAELNPICHLLTLVGAHHTLHVSRIRVNCGNAVSFTISETTSTPPLLPRSLHAGWCTSDPQHVLDLINDVLGCSDTHIQHSLLQELQNFKDLSGFKKYCNVLLQLFFSLLFHLCTRDI